MSLDGPDSLSERDRRDLTALADGSLSGRRRAALEARLDTSPDLRVALGQQRRAVAALDAISVEAPAGLRARVAAGSAEPARRPLRPAWVGAGAAALAAAIVAVVVLAGGAETPTVTDAAELSALAPTEPAPKPEPQQPTLLAASAEGLAYPNWAAEFGWRAVGQRSEAVGDREATTVFYEKDGQRIGYSIVSGEPLDPPPGATPATVDGTQLQVVRDGEHTVVTWLRDGHSCVLAGSGVDPETMVELAAWKGDGAVAF